MPLQVGAQSDAGASCKADPAEEEYWDEEDELEDYLNQNFQSSDDEGAEPKARPLEGEHARPLHMNAPRSRRLSSQQCSEDTHPPL